MQSRYYRELFPVEKEKMMSEMIWLLTNRQNNRYYEHIASPWRSRFVRLKMPVTGEDYDETDCFVVCFAMSFIGVVYNVV